MGYTFQASKYMNGYMYHFHFKNISMGYLFHPKVYELRVKKKKVYDWYIIGHSFRYE